jgi:hypothetical protein
MNVDFSFLLSFSVNDAAKLVRSLHGIPYFAGGKGVEKGVEK